MQLFGMGKGTIREALKGLEVQGLIRTRTGPGGGAFIELVSQERAVALLGNYFFSKDVTLRDIYAMRKVLAPDLAVSVVGRLLESDFQRLQANMDLYAVAPVSLAEERMQRMHELDFHDVLADRCPNPLLAFTCHLLHALLKDLAVCQRIYDTAQPGLRRSGFSYKTELLAALRANDAPRARQVMYEHMCAAERTMLDMETIIVRGFLDVSGGADRLASLNPAPPSLP